MKNKVVLISLVLLLSIAIVGVGAFAVIMNLSNTKASSEPKIDDIVSYSVDVPEITTNLQDGKFIKVSFKIQTDREDAKTELEKRDFQVKDIIIKEVSQMNAKSFNGKEGIISFENAIKSKVNELMQDGKVVKVYTTSFVLQ